MSDQLNKERIRALYLEFLAVAEMTPEEAVITGNAAYIMHGVLEWHPENQIVIEIENDVWVGYLRTGSFEEGKTGYRHWLQFTPSIQLHVEDTDCICPDIIGDVAVIRPEKLLLRMNHPMDEEEQVIHDRLIKLIDPDDPQRLKARIIEAKNIIVRYGGIDGDHHKTWVIDQAFRALCGETYREEVAKACAGEDGPETYDWDEGTPP